MPPTLPLPNRQYHARQIHNNSEENIDYVYLFDEQKRFIVQVTAVTAACTSLFLVTIIFYWFCRMRKRFRHKYEAHQFLSSGEAANETDSS